MAFLKRILGFIWHKKWIVLILLIVGGLIYQYAIPKGGTTSTEREYKVVKGVVSKTVTSTGQVSAVDVQDLTFGVQGRIAELKFKEGDFVNKGDYLGSLDTTTLQAQIKIAQGGLQAASGSFNNTKQSLDLEIQDMTNNVTELDKQIAEANRDTTLKVNENTVDRSKLGLKIAEEGINASEDALDNLDDEKDFSEDVSNASIDVSKLSSSEAEDLSEAQKDLSQFQYEGRIDSSENSLDVLELQKDQVEIDFDTTKINSGNTNLLSEIGLQKAQKQVELGDLRKQQTEISKKNTLSSLGGQILNAQGSLEIAKYNLNQAKLYAPFSGTLLKMPFKIGEYFSGPLSTSVIQIGDLSKFKVDTEINELDILGVKPGQKAIVEFDANPGKKFEGSVIKVNPAPQLNSTGVVNYLVEISLDPELKDIYHGLSANVEVVTEEKTDILQLPFVAIQRKEDGQYVKVKGKDGVITEKKIETGLQSINNVEILSGLIEDDIVIY